MSLRSDVHRLDIELLVYECPTHHKASVVFGWRERPSTFLSVEERSLIMQSLQEKWFWDYLDARDECLTESKETRGQSRRTDESEVGWWDQTLLARAGEIVHSKSLTITLGKVDWPHCGSRITLMYPAKSVPDVEQKELKKKHNCYYLPCEEEDLNNWRQRFSDDLSRMGITCTCSHSQNPPDAPWRRSNADDAQTDGEDSTNGDSTKMQVDSSKNSGSCVVLSER